MFSSFLFCYSSPQQHCTLVYFYFDRKVSSILEHRSLADSLSSLATRSLSQSISISFTGSSVPLPSPCFLEGFRPGPRRFLPGPATCSFLSLSLSRSLHLLDSSPNFPIDNIDKTVINGCYYSAPVTTGSGSWGPAFPRRESAVACWPTSNLRRIPGFSLTHTHTNTRTMWPLDGHG